MCVLVGTEDKEVITLAHGSGGKQTARLIDEFFVPAFHKELHDGALLNISGQNIVFTTDSYVVQPLFFPGGDIGTLAVNGTINDLAMCGAKPLYLSCGFIIEEGFLKSDLQRIVQSMQQAAETCGVSIVTGDTKVVERTGANNIFINTSGIGILMSEKAIHPARIESGDCIVLSGDIGRHGMAIMAAREGFSVDLKSDCAPLFDPVQVLIQAEIDVHCLRDPTRGGLATTLVELAEQAKLSFHIEEEKIEVSSPVKSVCEVLGFDPLYVANEGRFVAFVPESQAAKTLKSLSEFYEKPAIIGHVHNRSGDRVIINNALGTSRYLHRLVGDQLPRIC